MGNRRNVLCGGASPIEEETDRGLIHLQLWGSRSNIALKINDISHRMAATIPPLLVDLLEVSTYVYCADQAATRGGDSSRDYGAKWRRDFRFDIPVRLPDIWSSNPVRTALEDTLGFLSDDEYEFRFRKLSHPPSIEQYFDFGPSDDSGLRVDEVILFSGGLDSLAGAVQEGVVAGRNMALVSHRSSPKIAKRQKDLLQDLAPHCRSHPFHVPVWVNKDKALGREYTQLTRSFLYATLAAVVARIFSLEKILFYENGIISMNLPISPQVVGGRATRTTHPQVLNGFSRLFSALFQEEFAVENPFLWKTKTDVVRSIRSAGCANLIKHTVSCTHVWEMTTLKTHCGICSQCLGRRFATLSAGCSDEEDPPEIYEVDLLTGERQVGESRTMIESYVSTAKRMRDMSEVAFFSEFGAIHRLTSHIRGMSVDEAASGILGLHRRHATEVWNVITQGIRDHAQEISDGTIPGSCLLILALPAEYKSEASGQETAQSPPLLILDAVPDGETNRGLLARIVGRGRFDGVNKKIGSRELFFIYLLFRSTRDYYAGGERLTVVTEDEAAKELLRWSKEGYLRFSGKDRDAPKHRVQKMWGEFVKQMEKETKLKNLFRIAREHPNGDKVYAVHLHPQEKQILASSIPALFRRHTYPGNA